MSEPKTTNGHAAEDNKTKLPSDKSLQKLSTLSVKDSDGKDVSYKSIVNDPAHPRVLTIHIRHFFCGFCEQYLQALGRDPAVSPAALTALSPPTKIIVVGCGTPSLIVDYKARTGCQYDIYADPTRATYDALGYAVTLQLGGEPASYTTQSYLSTVWSSFKNNLRAGSKMLSGGKTAQQGGEAGWVDGELRWISRMASTTDHMSVDEVKAKLEA